MKKKIKILVTGGAGFIGSHTSVELYNNGFEPVIVDNFSNSDRSVLDGIEKIVQKKITVHTVDCNDLEALKEVFKIEKNIEGIIHFAALKAVGDSVKNPLQYYSNNLNSLINVIQILIERKIPNIVFSSSATVYGNQPLSPFHEYTPLLAAQSPYGNTKKIGEDILRDAVNAYTNLKVISLRYFNPIGAHPSSLIGELPNGIPNNLVPFITQTAAGIRKQLTVFGNDYNTPDGTCIRDYVHVMDLAAAHVKALNYLIAKSGKCYEDINIGTGSGYSVMELIQTFEKVSKEKLNYVIGKRREGDIPAMTAAVSKAENVLDWKAKRSLEDSLRDAWNWQKKIVSSDEQRITITY